MVTAGRGDADREATDADAGIWRGRSVARRFVSPDGFIVLVGRTAADNDVLSVKLADPSDFWLHVAGASGSHVVVRNPDQLDRLPRDTIRFAAALAAGHSRARAAARAEVHVARCRDVSKPRGAPPGQVALRRFTTVRVVPTREPGGPPSATAPDD
jgi:predicted ribosome quality control (RQC) complex YloA/Tae2 family protein